MSLWSWYFPPCSYFSQFKTSSAVSSLLTWNDPHLGRVVRGQRGLTWNEWGPCTMWEGFPRYSVCCPLACISFFPFKFKNNYGVLWSTHFNKWKIHCVPIACLALCLALWGPEACSLSAHCMRCSSPVGLWTWYSSCVVQVWPISSDLQVTELFWPHPLLTSIFFLGIHDNDPGNFASVAPRPFLTPFVWFSLKSCNWSLNVAISYPPGAPPIKHRWAPTPYLWLRCLSMLHSLTICPLLTSSLECLTIVHGKPRLSHLALDPFFFLCFLWS